MRYLIAIVTGALLAVLPPLMLVFPDLAWEHACLSVAKILPTAQGLGELVESPCGFIDETLEPLPVRVLMLSMLSIGCAIAGALAARIAERRRLAVAFLAPFLAYGVLFSWGRFNASLLPIAVGVALAAGALGTVGAGWRCLTNAWRATRSKLRAPLA